VNANRHQMDSDTLSPVAGDIVGSVGLRASEPAVPSRLADGVGLDMCKLFEPRPSLLQFRSTGERLASLSYVEETGG
jgi:hypothetical protein